MWRNFKFLCMADVEKSDISPHDKLVWCFSGAFVLFCHILCCFLGQKRFLSDLRYFVAKSVLSRFTRFYVEKNRAKNCIRGEKMTNMRYAPPPVSKMKLGPKIQPLTQDTTSNPPPFSDTLCKCSAQAFHEAGIQDGGRMEWTTDVGVASFPTSCLQTTPCKTQ